MKIFCLAGMLSLLLVEMAAGQMYRNQNRPAGQNWHELTGSRFRILFPEGEIDRARLAASILEQSYPTLQNQVGGTLKRFPVILNMENDRSNGFVSPLNFRSEIEAAPMRSKVLNPRSGEWLDQVLPHELVHALHFNVQSGGVSAIIGLFSSDLRRSVHAAAPIGLFEGIAVYHETHSTPFAAGRGNYPWFTGRYQSIMQSDRPWSLGQHVQPPAATRPFDRHYIGSYHFTEWLLDRYGRNSMKEAIRIHHQWPMFGFGFALRRVTGDWPGELYRQFRHDTAKQAHTHPMIEQAPVTLPGLEDLSGITVRRPLWIDRNTLLFHAGFYNAPSGFYSYLIDDQVLTLELEQQVSDDYLFHLDSGRAIVTFSYYRIDGRYDHVERLDLKQYRINSNTITTLTRNLRLFSPSGQNPIHAIQIDGNGTKLVTVQPDINQADPVGRLPEHFQFHQITHHPQHHGLIAVLVRRGADTAIWIINGEEVSSALDRSPNIYIPDASLFDLNWHPNDRRLLFTSDFAGSFDLFEYDQNQHSVFQLTDSPLNQFEGAWSPDGKQIAYVFHKDAHTLPSILDRSRIEPGLLDEELWKGERFHSEPEQLLSIANKVFVDTTTQEWKTRPWRTGLSWIPPRTTIPTFGRHGSGFYQIGASLHSTDLLGRHTYRFQGSHLNRSLWFDLDYRYSGFYPGIGSTLYQRPVTRRWDSLDPVRTLTRHRGASLYLPIRYTFRRDTRLTELHLRPELGYRQSVDLQTDLVPGVNRYTNDRIFTRLHLTNYIRLRQFIRQSQPGSGWIIFGSSDVSLHSDTRFDGSYNLSETERWGFQAGIYRYLTPFQFRYQSLRIGSRLLIQSDNGPYDRDRFHSFFFADTPFPGSRKTGIIDSRYTIPLLHPDDGGFLIPAYLSQIYLVLFSETALSLDRPEVGRLFNQTHSVVGAGIRSRMRLSNFSFEIGAAFGFDLLKRDWVFGIGDF